MAQEQPTTDEINLVRLLRRLEKTVGNEEEWTAGDVVPAEEVMLRARKTVQTVKFARRLIKTVEVECEDTPVRLKRLNDAKIQLDRIDKFLNELQKSLEPRVERVSLLSTLPLPRPKTDEKREEELSIIPPDAGEVSPVTRTLLPIDSSATTALREELSLQLEQMARQLKRNAIHFSASLENDQTVIADAGTKLERNYDVMQGQRVRLRRRGRGGWGTTCVAVGVVFVTAVVCLLVAVVIRVS